jgi:hypothetical protein
VIACARTWAATEIPPPLADALAKLPQDYDHWAYTETRNVTDMKGRATETVIRFDPSKPYAEQFTPLKIEGKEPSSRQLEDYRKRGERRGKRIERDEAEGKTPGMRATRLNINGNNISVDLERAVLRPDAPPGALLYDVPLKNDGSSSLPVEKFQLQARLNAGTHALENVTFKLREPLRVKLIANIKSGEASIDFTTIDPKFNSYPTAMTGDAKASILFISIGGKFKNQRTDFQRVKPYSERFGVKIGPTKALDFD